MSRNRAESRRSRGESGGFMDNLSLAVTLLVVSVFAVFTGYLVGQYAVYWLAAPIVGEARPGSSGARVTASTQTAVPASLQGGLGQTGRADQSGSAAQSGPGAAGSQPGASTARPAGNQQPASSNPAPAPTAVSPAQGSAATERSTAAQGANAAQGPAPAQGSPAAQSPAVQSTGAPQPTVYRVQVGHFATLSAANAALQALKAKVPDAWVVYDAQSGEYRVQAGAFSSRARAEEFAGELVALGHNAFVFP